MLRFERHLKRTTKVASEVWAQKETQGAIFGATAAAGRSCAQSENKQSSNLLHCRLGFVLLEASAYPPCTFSPTLSSHWSPTDRELTQIQRCKEGQMNYLAPMPDQSSGQKYLQQQIGTRIRDLVTTS